MRVKEDKENKGKEGGKKLVMEIEKIMRISLTGK